MDEIKHELGQATNSTKDQFLELKSQHEEKISAFEKKLTDITNTVNHLHAVITPVEEINNSIARLTEQKDELVSLFLLCHQFFEYLDVCSPTISTLPFYNRAESNLHIEVIKFPIIQL